METIYDTVFVYINVVNNHYITGAEYQLESAYIRSYLQQHDIKTMQYINKKIGNEAEIIEDLASIPCKSVTFYINEYNYYITRITINRLRASKDSLQIYALGPSVKFFSRNIMEDTAIDICINHCEAMTLQEVLSSVKDINQIDNITYRSGENIVCAKTVLKKFSLDDLGLIYSSKLIPVEEIQNTGMLSSIGCYGKCSFCSYNSAAGFKVHSIKNILMELDYIRSHVNDKDLIIRFFDDCFSVSTARTLALCREIAAKKYNFQFWCCIRSDLLSYSLIDLMAECNFENIVIGLETASELVMSRLGKAKPNDPADHYIEDLRQKFHYAMSKGINPLFSVNFGLPYEELEDALKTVEFIQDNSAQNNISICFTTCFPGSRIFGDSGYYQINKEPSPTLLPYRTYFDKYNIRMVVDRLKSIHAYQNEIYQKISIYDIFMQKISNFITGTNTLPSLHNSVDCIHVDELDTEVTEFIDKVIDINGTVIFYIDKLKLYKNDLFTEDRKNLRLAIQIYDDNLQNSVKSNKFLPHQVFLKSFGDETAVQIDNLYKKEPLKVKIERLDDLEKLQEMEQKAQIFFNTDSISVHDISDNLVENCCSFSGECCLCSIPRLTVKGHNIYACLGRQIIGSVKETYAELIRTVNTILKSNDGTRNCTDCEAKSWCTKCIFPPKYLNREQYCLHVKNNPYLGFYLKLKTFLKSIIDVRNISDTAIKVRYASKYNSLNKSNQSSLVQLKDDVILVEYDSSQIISRMSTGQYTTCNDIEKTVFYDLLGIKTPTHINSEINKDIITVFKVNGLI